MNDRVVYQGRDLEAMVFAINYHRWILEYFRPFLGQHVVEVGAGSGSFSELILECPIESLSLIEPSEAMYDLLLQYTSRLRTRARLATYNSIFRHVSGQLKAAQHPNSVIYVNVLEHIEDDEGELRAIYDTLECGGRLFLFVPALRWLFSTFDKQIGHFRRYTKAELEGKCRNAGFKVLKSAYFDLLGIAPWWTKYKLLRSETMELQAVHLYDKYCVQASKLLDLILGPPVGKNVILVAERPTHRNL